MQFLNKFFIFRQNNLGDTMENASFSHQREQLRQVLRFDQSFDIVERKITIGNKKAALYFVDGFAKDDILEKIMEFFYKNVKPEDLQTPEIFKEGFVPYVEVDLSSDFNSVATAVLSGICAVLVDGFDKAVLIDSRTYPQRETSEPENDKVLFGSRDGFVETMVLNTALIRRRIRSADLRIEAMQAGTKSKTDIALCYMDGKVDKKLLCKLKEKIKNIECESLTMSSQSLVEAIYSHRWFNPMPKVKNTERPDTTSNSILKGNIAIIVDNSPAALILPTSIFDILEEADDYYFSPVTGTYLRLARYAITFASLFITPVWLLLLQNPNILPQSFNFILLDQQQNIPVFWQLIIIEIGIDGLRLASLNTPNSLTTPLSIIGAIALSDFAVQTGWCCYESILYMAFVTVANYTQPNYELGYTIKFSRIFLLILTYLFNVWGFAAGVISVILLTVCNRTLSGKSYLYPLIPFNPKELLYKLIRLR